LFLFEAFPGKKSVVVALRNDDTTDDNKASNRKIEKFQKNK